MTRLVDLSVPLASDKDWAPRWARTGIKYQDHAYGRRVIRLMLRLPAKYLKTRLGWAHEQIKLSTHGTTHLDAFRWSGATATASCSTCGTSATAR